jgi:hypothetical protein
VSGSRGVCFARSSVALPALDCWFELEVSVSGNVIIGMDPHKRSATIEVMNEQETVLDSGRFSTDAAGYRAMLAMSG